MKPILSKTETTSINGEEIKLVGEVYEKPLKSSAAHGDVFSEINFLNWRGEKIHPGFSYITALSDEELDFELKHHARNIVEKPKAYNL